MRATDLEKYDQSLTVGQLVQTLKEEQEVKDSKVNAEVEQAKTYENTYFKLVGDCNYFGKALKVYSLTDYIRKEYDTDWKLHHYFRGDVISFGKREINLQVLNPDRVGGSFTLKELKEVTKITKEEFENYLEQYEEIKSQLERLIAG